MTYRGINWNNAEDPFDVQVWDQLVSQYWLPERFSIGNDLRSWSTLTDQEKLTTTKVFTGLTVLDTLQGRTGSYSLLPDAITDIEEAWLGQILHMESIHAKSYSNIFMTLLSTKEINTAFRWSEENEQLQYKARICDQFYKGDDPLKRKVASVLLESFLFYSGFYLPLYWQSIGKLVNTGDMVKAIIRDEAVHGAAIGYKYQKGLEKVSNKSHYQEFTFDLLEDLYDNEVTYAQDLYDGLDMTEDVKKFVRYNGNRALQNLGYDGLFNVTGDNAPSAAIINGMSLGAVTTDFFSTTGAYALAKAEEITDSDFDW